MAALVQTYSQPTSSTTMLQTRPSSSGSIMNNNQPNASRQYSPSSSQAPRSVYHANGSAGYRGSSAPAQPFAFSSTPNLSQTLSWQQYGGYRTSSSPSTPTHPVHDSSQNHRAAMQNNAQGYLNSFGVSHGGSRDDSAITPSRSLTPTARPQSYLSVSTQPSFSTSTKQSGPDRYRRTSSTQNSHHTRSHSSTMQSSPSMLSPSQSYQASRRYSTSSLTTNQGLMALTSMDDLQQYKKAAQEEALRLRRRSVHPIESSRDNTSASPVSRESADSKQVRVMGPEGHSRNASSESVSSTRSSHSRPSSATSRHVSVSTGNPSLPASDETHIKNDQQRMLNIPSRGSSSDVVKRTHSPSPLSKPATMANEAAEDSTPQVDGATAKLDSPAAKQLAALNQKGSKGRSKTSRLRRAFSFGSAAEFRKASEGDEKLEPSKLHKDPTPEEAYDVEQARIAEAQEAGGIGNSIYGARFFGSTDNLSISSTASSASIMIRKMGRGMKKSSRSLVGLFRPKSATGVPVAEPLAPEASQATVSMVTVEAETQRVNVTANPHGTNGGTGFPRLERNSIDAAQASGAFAGRPGNSAGEQPGVRKSIVGGDSERAEVLAAVRKGILKRPGSPAVRPGEGPASSDLVLPNIPSIADSPMSSTPSTPVDDGHGHKRTGSIAIGSEDYFMSALRLRQDSQSGTPPTKRNATFSPRLIFCDTWPSQEYDRRGEIATCNRLTPHLAQQIKEELNSFKMVRSTPVNSVLE
ncbi:hypothetical protein E4U42_004615 [Claviceps africana]|uniref:Protein BNI4 n=1 Tax=Claviceps africana TaxID=83212 RepID=A0A8K0NGW2_9HYPO|nr:hypothetical protein E4U42_004615 [Claviceps africana]